MILKDGAPAPHIRVGAAALQKDCLVRCRTGHGLLVLLVAERVVLRYIRAPGLRCVPRGAGE